MRFKKGQTATEYLIILAVVIVIALIVVGVLGGIPSIGGGAKSNSASSYWRTAKIGVTSVVTTTDGLNSESIITFRNNMPGTIKITGVELTDSSSKTGSNSSSTIVTSGGSATYVILVNDTNLKASDSYSFDIAINYTDEAAAEYQFTGDGNSLEGTVAIEAN